MIKIDIGMEFEGEILDYTSDGRGVLKINSYPIFVPYTAVGDLVKIVIVKNKKSYFEGKLINVLEKSKDRVTPECNCFEKCGGCDLLHINYAHQLEFKKNTVKKALKKIAKNENITVNNPIGSDNNCHYRNKAIYNFQKKEDKIIAGFFEKKSKNIIEPIDCLIVDKNIESIRKILQNFCNDINFMPLRLAVKHSFETKEIMVCLVINEKKFKYKDQLIKELKSIDDIKSIIINYADKNTVNFGRKSETIYGKDYIIEKLNGISFKNYLTSFFQVNPSQTLKLYNTAINSLDLTKKDTLLDLYCGVGTLSLLCADKVADTIGIESVDYAIKSAKKNAIENDTHNSKFILGNAEDLLKYINDYESLKIIVDPPRKGLDKKVIDSISSLSPTKIAYISCDEGTMARDIAIFEKLNFKAIHTTPVDMFCSSYHIETVTLLEKQ